MQYAHYIKYKLDEKRNFRINTKIYDKLIILIACHCNSKTKWELLQNNLKYFNHFKIICIQSKEEIEYQPNIKKLIEETYHGIYIELPNSFYMDYGKWVFAMNEYIDIIKLYEYVICTNDSYYICSSIDFFLESVLKSNVQLYGYNDSNEIQYHYQSYLFGLHILDAMIIFINNVNNKDIIILDQEDVINHFEVKMLSWFHTTNVYLKLCINKKHNNKNIFFNNEPFYTILFKTKLLPFIKYKKLFMQ